MGPTRPCLQRRGLQRVANSCGWTEASAGFELEAVKSPESVLGCLTSLPGPRVPDQMPPARSLQPLDWPKLESVAPALILQCG